MRNCTHCKYAYWDRTEAGRLHPSGQGRCKFPYKTAPLPQSMYWLGRETPCGGHISRREELKDHCVYYTYVSPLSNNAPADAGKDLSHE